LVTRTDFHTETPEFIHVCIIVRDAQSLGFRCSFVYFLLCHYIGCPSNCHFGIFKLFLQHHKLNIFRDMIFVLSIGVSESK